jgi:hypothetical protein
MTFPQFLIFSGVAVAWLTFVFRNVSCKHDKHFTFPTGGYGAAKMTGKQTCLDCGAERFYKLGEPGEWFYREHKRSAQ